MGIKRELLLTSALLTVAIPSLRAALAADLGSTPPAMPVKAAPNASDAFELHGEVDAGWRTFVQRPPDSPQPGDPSKQNRAKMDEYGTIGPGPFVDYLHLLLESRNNPLRFEVTAKNIDQDFQDIHAELSKAGEYYLRFGWDDTPHLYSTSAQSLWGGSPTFLTTNLSLFNTLGKVNNTPTTAQLTAAEALINANVHTTSIGIQRETATTSLRYTPTPDWDVNASYSHLQRTGTQMQGMVFNTNGNMPSLQVSKPVDDTTQNADVSAEYSGYSFWGEKYNVKLAYGASLYQDAYSSFIVQNPFGDPTGATAKYPAYGQMSTWPDNHAQSFTVAGGADLPFDSRYMGTASYSMMRQNDAFIPESINPLIKLPTPAASSLNGAINTLLVNSVVNTQISKDVKSTLRYRYYDVDNQTPELAFSNYVIADASLQTNGSDASMVRRALALSYNKQNASEDLTWRPTHGVSVGTTAAWERWDRDNRDVNVTNEYSGKIYGDATVMDWMHLRSSYLFSTRRYQSYDFADYVAQLTYVPNNGTTSFSSNNSLMRMFDMADRDRNKAQAQIDLDVPGGLTITPNAGLQYDNYGVDPTIGTLGVQHDNSWRAGVDLSYRLNEQISLFGTYMRESFDRSLIGSNGITNDVTGVSNNQNRFYSRMKDRVDTYTVGANFDVVPDVLSVDLGYTYAHDIEHWDDVVAWVSGTPTASPFPDVKNDYQRLEATAKYKVDPDLVRRVAWVGDVTVKLRYVWERNAVTNWQDDLMPDVWLVDNTAYRMTSLDAVNPNYDAQLISASVTIKW